MVSCILTSGGEFMKEYSVLFNAITDAIQALQELQMALIEAQQKAEELYIEGED